MQLGLLDAKNPGYESHEKLWRICSALYHGGVEFESMLSYFLPQNPQEPMDVYQTRCQEAAYLSYVGPIITYFVAWLFSGSFQVRAKEAAGEGKPLPTDSYYSKFQADVGGDISLSDFMRERTIEALIKRCSHWLIELPELDADQAARISSKQMSKDEYQKLGLGHPTLRGIDRLSVWDWDTDEHGKLLWVKIHSKEKIVKNPRYGMRDVTRETWRIYDQRDVETFVLEYTDRDGRPKDPDFEVGSTGVMPHRFLEVPLVTLDVGNALWVGERTRQPQIEHFRLSVAKNWLIRRTCYAMPILKLEDPQSEPGVMGSGYYLKLGKEDKFEWTAPPVAPFDVIQASIDAQRDEIFRVVHQMAQGMDNNADTVGRSADSKQIDTAATRIILNAYGAVVRKAIEETLEILSDSQGDDDTYWSVEGFSGYDTATAAELIANATEAQILGIPSKTFRAEMKIKTALALMPELDPEQKERIRSEIRTAIDSMDELEELVLPVQDQTKLDIQDMKGSTALQVEDKKAKVAAKKPAPKPAAP